MDHPGRFLLIVRTQRSKRTNCWVIFRIFELRGKSAVTAAAMWSAAAPAGGRRRVNTATAEREHVPLALKLPSSGPLVNSQTGGSCLQICSTWQHCCSVCSSAALQAPARLLMRTINQHNCREQIISAALQHCSVWAVVSTWR